MGLAHALSRWWRHDDPVQAGFAERMLVHVELEKVRAIAEIQRARLERFPARHRKHYAPEERFQILVLMHTYGLNRSETAHIFLVDPQTISRWQREALAEPETESIGTLVRARPPLRGYDDVVKRLVQMLDTFDIGGSKKIAQMLARAGLKIGRETVRRYRKAPRPPRPAGSPMEPPRILRAKYVNHIWLADLTEIRGFLGLFMYKLVVVLDMFSRFPLSFGVFRKEPTVDLVLQVLDRAMRRHGRPRHFVSDQGSQFTATVFRETSTHFPSASVSAPSVSTDRSQSSSDSGVRSRSCWPFASGLRFRQRTSKPESSSPSATTRPSARIRVSAAPPRLRCTSRKLRPSTAPFPLRERPRGQRPEMSRSRSRSSFSTPNGVCLCSYRPAKRPDKARSSIHLLCRLSARQVRLCLGRDRGRHYFEEANPTGRPKHENQVEISEISPLIQPRNSHWGTTESGFSQNESVHPFDSVQLKKSRSCLPAPIQDSRLRHLTPRPWWPTMLWCRRSRIRRRRSHRDRRF